MTAATDHSDHLTAYERAVCYYTLPHVTSPLNAGLVIVYAVIVLEAFGLLVYGVIREEPAFTRWGLIAVITTIVFGIVVFFGRALISSIRERRVLAQAHAAPDREADIDLPDPFEGHVLLRFDPGHDATEVAIETNEGEAYRTIVKNGHHGGFTIQAPDGSETIHVEPKRTRRSFLFDPTGNASDVSVLRDGKEIARTHRRYTFGDSSSDIYCEDPEQIHIVTRGGGFYRNDRLVGRFYLVNQAAYLDIEKSSLNDGVLAYFVAMV